jgi:adenylate kinase
MPSATRKDPNIVITGTPGVGKSSHASLLASRTGLKHLEVSKLAKDRGCTDGFDEELQTAIVDEDKLLDAIEDEMHAGGNIVDWHACDLFPESWVDLVVVVRCDSTILYDRLKDRGYSAKKIEENLDVEIMQVLLDEAREAFDEEVVVELRSDDVDELEGNVDRIVAWIENWKKDNGPQREEDD